MLPDFSQFGGGELLTVLIVLLGKGKKDKCKVKAMFDRLILYFLEEKKKFEYIEKNAQMIGSRSINGMESVLYMLGSGFVEVIRSDNQKKLKFFKSLDELNESY
ncbi:MAG: hypothetical protein OEW75_14590 [Cyclobacteriaceae bacterium]|nr:hypothetical protein [Cyclobacteriaceae bacterium]